MVSFQKNIQFTKNHISSDAVQNAFHDLQHECASSLSIMYLTIDEALEQITDPESHTHEIQETLKQLYEEVKLLQRQIQLHQQYFIFMNQEIENISIDAIFLDKILINIQKHLQTQTKKVEIKCKNNTVIKSNSGLLLYILNEILQNAFQNSKSDPDIHISVSTDTTHTICSIQSNNDIGIKDSEIKQITKKYFRSQDSQYQYRGTGLSLSLVKKICDALKISLFFSKKQDFSFTTTLKFPHE